MNLLAGFLSLIFVIWAFERFYLRGWPVAKLSVPTDPDAHQRFTRADGPGPEHLEVVKSIRQLISKISVRTQKTNLLEARSAFDSISDGHEYKSQFVEANAAGVAAEWVISPGADGNRRLLYIHGGGFVLGSPKSHRTITDKLSELANCAVLAIDYRMMPEYYHRHCVEDCRKAYQWVLENGPDGPSEPHKLFVAGDSAGGNLTLSLLPWARDNGLRSPDAAVALSPLTDVTFSGESLRSNQSTDVMLKPFMKALNAIPPFVKSWWVLWTYRIRPGNPVVSPLLGKLSGLAPTLVQASEAEMLYDDGRRYVYKARAAGSPATFQSWPDMVHIWQIFYPELPQAREAFDEIEKFLNKS